MASAGLALGINQVQHGIENDDPVDVVFGGLGIAFSFGLQAQALRSVVPPSSAVSAASTKGPAATQELLAEFEALSEVPFKRQTVALIETQNGPTVLSANNNIPLTQRQIALADRLGIKTVENLGKDFHAEIQGMAHVGDQGLFPTRGVVSNRICTGGDDSCTAQLTEWFRLGGHQFEIHPDGKSFEIIRNGLNQ